MKKYAIIGAGAAGMAAGVVFNLNNVSVDIYEASNKVLKKVFASGNGRCNLSNINLDSSFYHNEDYFHYDRYAFLNLLNENNLEVITDNEGRMYPLSNTSKSVCNLLIDLNKKNNIYLNTSINNIKVVDNKVLIADKLYDKVLITTGSLASVNASYNPYFFVDDLSLSFNKVRPSLVGFKVKENIKALQGLRVKVKASLYKDDDLIYEEDGEVTFRSDGVAGIVIFNLSFYCDDIKNNNYYLVLNMYPNLNNKVLKYNVNPLLYNYLKVFKDIDIHNFKLSLLDFYSLKEAQSASGGLVIKEINHNFSLKKYPNLLYVAGEVIDVDAKCGGYSLNFAFNSGIKAALSMLEK